jgi:two-component system, sensor histidine kinase FlrB
VGDSRDGLVANSICRAAANPAFTQKASGTGFGLAIVRRTIEAHGGRIAVEANAGRGVTFRIELPAA